MILTRAFLIVAAVFASFVTNAQAAKRVALVIGNGAYATVVRLPDPAHDAEAMAGLFASAGFDTIEKRIDASRAQMTDALRKFASEADGADIAVVFYAGHGLEMAGENYLLPIDANIAKPIDVKYETVALNDVLEALDGATKLKLVLLDACRNNPFADAMKTSTTARAVGRGLAPLASNFGANLMIAYAAAPGQLALDGAGADSPFTEALLKNLTAPGTDIRIALGGVRDDVVASTQGEQIPYQTGSIGKALVLLGPPVEAPPPSPTVDPDAPARADFALAERVATVGGWDTFLDKYPTGLYATLARAERDKLLAMLPKTSPGAAPDQIGRVEPKADIPIVTPQAAPPVDELAHREIAQLQRLSCLKKTTQDWGDEAVAAVRRFDIKRQAHLYAGEPYLAAIEELAREPSGACSIRVGDAKPPKPIKSAAPERRPAWDCVMFNGVQQCP